MASRAELGAVSAVVSFLMTGAFILQNFGVPPLLPATFSLLFGANAVPPYFGIALGATGAYQVVYQLFFTLFLSPIDCFTDRDYNFDSSITVDRINFKDLLNIFMTFLLYDWILVFSFDVVSPVAFIGGFGIILTTLVFRVVPRFVSDYIRDDCFWTIKVTLVSIPVTILVFLPTIYFINVFG